jgi:hypothetical protein
LNIAATLGALALALSASAAQTDDPAPLTLNQLRQSPTGALARRIFGDKGATLREHQAALAPGERQWAGVGGAFAAFR